MTTLEMDGPELKSNHVTLSTLTASELAQLWKCILLLR
jgi:hypothetical protein